MTWGGHRGLLPKGWARASHFLQKDPGQTCPQAPPTPSTRQPLTQLIAGLAAGTAGLIVVFPGQKGALWTGEAGGHTTRLCAGGLQVVPCGTQCGVSQRGLPPSPPPSLALLSASPPLIPSLPTSTPQPHLTLTCLWTALTSSHVPPTPSAPHLLDSPCSSPDHSALGSCGRSHTGGWGCWPGHPAAAGRGGPRGQGLLAPSLAAQAGASLCRLSHPSACPQVLEQRRCPWVEGETDFLPLGTDRAWEEQITGFLPAPHVALHRGGTRQPHPHPCLR